MKAYAPKTIVVDRDWFRVNTNWSMPDGRYEVQIFLNPETLEKTFTFRYLDPVTFPTMWTVGILPDGVTPEDIMRKNKEYLRDHWDEWEPRI